MALAVKRSQFKEADLSALSRLVMAARQLDSAYGSLTVSSLASMLKEEFGGTSCILLEAVEEGEITGIVFLRFAGRKTAVMNPGPFLGGLPIVSPEANQINVASTLIQESKSWAKEEGLNRLELIETSAEENAFLLAEGFQVKLRYASLICDLINFGAEEITAPAGYSIEPLTETGEEDLYQCYYSSFQRGDAGFFFELNEEERRKFFKDLEIGQALGQESSLIIKQNEQLVGFISVLPYGMANVHVSCMSVDPGYQGQGFGELLLRSSMQKAAGLGYKTMTLGTETNMRAFYFYRKNGFEVLSTNTTWECRL